MTWWQTLIVAVVPAAVTALALLGQNWLAGRRDERQQVRADARADATARRAEMLAAHTAALTAIGDIEHALQMGANQTLARLEAGTYTRPDVVPVSKSQLGVFSAALASVQLMCGWEAARRLLAFYAAVHAIGVASAAKAPTPEEIGRAQNAAEEAKIGYLAAAKDELGLEF